MNRRSKQRAIVISASSDIGTALCERWITYQWDIFGTYRTYSPKVDELRNRGVTFVSCDLNDSNSIGKACCELKKLSHHWDILVVCPGMLDPIGPFEKCHYQEWEDSIKANFTGQLRVVHELLPCRNPSNELGACVLFFAGGGTNSAVVNYSAYTVSKIALIKMCELLDAEISDARFSIIGPGWVKTKIHEQTLRAGKLAGNSHSTTKEKILEDDFTPIDDILDCFDWLIGSSKNIMSGRNFSVVFDKWGAEELSQKLLDDSNMFKLRRSGNKLINNRGSTR